MSFPLIGWSPIPIGLFIWTFLDKVLLLIPESHCFTTLPYFLTLLLNEQQHWTQHSTSQSQIGSFLYLLCHGLTSFNRKIILDFGKKEKYCSKRQFLYQLLSKVYCLFVESHIYS